jgi:hypothetical protein
MRLLRGGPLIHFRNPCAITPDPSTRITPPLSGSSFGTSYSVTFNSSSSSAPLHKRVLTAYLAALKTSDAPSQAACEKTTVEASLSDYFPSLALMDRLTIRQS